MTEHGLPRMAYANSISQVFQNGANKPLLIHARCKKSGESLEVVMKPSFKNRMYPSSMMGEMICSFLALEFNLNTPSPVFVETSKEFIESSRGTVFYDLVENSYPYHFGTLYLKNTFDYFPSKSLSFSADLLSRILIFDLFIDNIDRGNPNSALKPNVFVVDGKMYLIDHEMAFASLLEIFFRKENPLLGQLKNVIENHLFYSELVAQGDKISDFIDSGVQELSRFDGQFWNKLFETIPDPWGVDYLSEFNKIKDFCLDRISRLDEFRDGIRKLLL